jgi:hypothetical protein
MILLLYLIGYPVWAATNHLPLNYAVVYFLIGLVVTYLVQIFWWSISDSLKARERDRQFRYKEEQYQLERKRQREEYLAQKREEKRLRQATPKQVVDNTRRDIAMIKHIEETAKEAITRTRKTEVSAAWDFLRSITSISHTPEIPDSRSIATQPKPKASDAKYNPLDDDRGYYEVKHNGVVSMDTD